MIDKPITEYIIAYKDGEEFISVDKDEADEQFARANKAAVEQYFAKTWVFENGGYQEDYVEVYFG